MRMRWKLLAVFLCISLAPILVLRWNGQRTIRKIGEDLAKSTRNTLVERTASELKSLVEEHATILKRERELIEMALQFQASELEKRFSASSDPLKNIPFKPSEHGLAKEIFHPSDKHLVIHPRMGRRSLQVSYNDQTYRIPADLSEGAKAETLNKLSYMIPIYRALERKHPDLIFWQLVRMENGIQSVYPAIGQRPMMRGSLMQSTQGTEWYESARTNKALSWSPPSIDPVTRQMVVTVSMPIRHSDGRFMGATAIMVPVSVLLQEDEHIRKLSKNAITLLIRVETPDGSPRPGIQIVAREQKVEQMHHHWQVPLATEWLDFNDPKPLEGVIEDLQKRRTNVRKVSHSGHDSVVAYGCIDAYCTALLIIVREADVVAEATAMEAYVRNRIGDQIRITGFILIGVILLVVFIAVVLSRSFTQNIQKLAQGARRLTTGDFSTRVEIKTRDEIGELGKTFNRMIPALEEHIEMRKALGLAMEVQQSLLPKIVPEIDGLDIAGRSLYCDETGGDLFDFLEVCCGAPDRIGVAVGDVSGHGISSALLMATVRALLRCRVTQPGGISEIITDVNRLLTMDTQKTCQFMTLFYLQISPPEKKLTWVRAGHDPALLYDPSEGCFVELRGTGMALGVDRTFEYESYTRTGLSRGQIILIGTDGIWEAHNASGERYGKDRFKDIIRRHAKSSADEILSTVTDSLREFRGPVSQEDDVTLVIIKIDR